MNLGNNLGNRAAKEVGRVKFGHTPSVVSQDDSARRVPSSGKEKKALFPNREIVIEWFVGNFSGDSFLRRRMDTFINKT